MEILTSKHTFDAVVGFLVVASLAFRLFGESVSVLPPLQQQNIAQGPLPLSGYVSGKHPSPIPPLPSVWCTRDFHIFVSFVSLPFPTTKYCPMSPSPPTGVMFRGSSPLPNFPSPESLKFT